MISTYQIIATILILFSFGLVNAAPLPSPQDNRHDSIIDISPNLNIPVRGQQVEGAPVDANIAKRQFGEMGIPSFGGSGGGGIPSLGGSGASTGMPDLGSMMPSMGGAGGAGAGGAPAMPGVPDIAGTLGKVPVVGSLVSSLSGGSGEAA